jgi:hypothetical protein
MNEMLPYLSAWFNKTEAEINEYVELMDMKNVDSLSVVSKENNDDDDEGDTIDPLNKKTTKSPYADDRPDNPLDQYLRKHKELMRYDTVLTAFNKTQERSRQCYRSLFTAYCIDSGFDIISFSDLLDNNIIEEFCKNGKTPTQYEIYQKYHPKAKQKSAEAMSSKMIKDFLNILGALSKEEKQDISC